MNHKSGQATDRVQKFLFDTSAIRALSGEQFFGVDKYYASPYCFWEILSHLEENYDRFRGILLKFAKFQMLDDPWAALDHLAMVKNFNQLTRIPDGKIITSVLMALEAHATLESFYAQNITFINQVRLVSDCASRTTDILHKREGKYVELCKRIIEAFRREKIRDISVTDYHDMTEALLEGEKYKLIERGAQHPDLIEMIRQHMYVYCLFILHRVYQRFINGNEDVDVNDYEDANICLHLSLDSSYCLVTKDKGMKKAVDEIIQVLNEIGIEHTLCVEDITRFQNKKKEQRS